MSRYIRVLPRDLFNESSLLKCLGRLSLLIEDGMAPEGMSLEHSGLLGFEIDQDPGSGDIYCRNLLLVAKGGRALVWRSLNSRGKWPVHIIGEEEIEIFNEEGNFTPEFLAWANGEESAP